LSVAVDEDVVVEFRGELCVGHDAIKCPVDTLRDLSIHNTIIQLCLESIVSSCER